MKMIFIKRIICTVLIATFLASTTYTAQGELKNLTTSTHLDGTDFDPLVDVTVTVDIKQIRTLEKQDIYAYAVDKIDRFSDPDFYIKIFINEVEFPSSVWQNTKYIYDPQLSATLDVPDDEEFVNIKIQLWDWDPGFDKICDISSYTDDYLDSYDVDLIYSIKTGHWWGDDYAYYEPVMFDPSGYGRLNGCDDNSIYENDKDCEIWFDIYQNDFDGDGIPYWTEVNIYGTDPEIDNTGEDSDDDGVPIEWEHKWGHTYSEWSNEHFWYYDPFEWNDHANLDPDEDGLDNVEEYLTSQWGSDPFRRDIFVELDQMEKGPNDEGNTIPELAKDLMIVAFAKQNIVFHIDDGCMGGGELIPFDDATTDNELQQIYWNYFLHNDENNWRRGVFHYALIIYNSTEWSGFAFGVEVNGTYFLDSFQISTEIHEVNPFKHYLFWSLKRRSINREYHRAISYASIMMHETGHTLGIFRSNTPGCDDRESVFPKRNWWKYRNYKSCMNYNYAYCRVDYSDGSRGRDDFDDWDRIDLTLFQRSFW